MINNTKIPATIVTNPSNPDGPTTTQTRISSTVVKVISKCHFTAIGMYTCNLEWGQP